MEFWNVVPGRKQDTNARTGARMVVVLAQPLAHFRSPDAHNCIAVGLIRRTAVEDIDADVSFLEQIGRTVDSVLNDVAQELLAAQAPMKLCRGQYPLQFSQYGLFLLRSQARKC